MQNSTDRTTKDLGRRLQHARERGGLTLAQVRDRTSIGESSISEFENDKREPSISQLSKLADCYRRSLAFFLSADPIQEDRVLWRQKPESAKETEAQFLRLCEQYNNLEVWCDRRASADLPWVRGPVPPFTFPRAEELARTVRKQLSLGDYPALGLLRELEENCGVKVFHLEFEPTGTAACAKGESFGAAVLLNMHNVRWRQNFDLAHELFHLLTWDVRHGGDTSKPDWSDEDDEKFANKFASALLMPEESLRSAVTARLRDDHLPVDALFEVARQFDVSVEALLWRMQDVFRRKAAETKRDIEKAKSMSSQLLRHRSPEPAPDRPARFRALAITALRRGELSLGRFAEYLGISRKQAATYMDEEDGADEAIAIASA